MAATQATLTPLPVDHSYSKEPEGEGQEGAEVYEEEEHHSWLGGSTAVKYLLAGGVAGAGEHVSSLRFLSPDESAPSFANVYRTVRPAEDIPDHSTTRPDSCRYVKIVRYEGDHQCDNEDIRREWSSWVLDRKWTIGCKDPSRICYQIPLVRVLCKVFSLLEYGAFDVNNDRRNKCLPRTGTTLRTLVRSAGSAGSCRVASVVSQVNSVCDRPVYMVGHTNLG